VAYVLPILVRIKAVFLDVLLGIATPLLISLVLLTPIILPRGIPFYGDETYYYINFESFYFNPLNWLFQWTPARGPAPLLTFFSYSIPLASLVALFGQELAVKAFILVVASLPGILTYFALKILVEEWSLFSDEKRARLFALTGSLFVLLSFTNSGLGGAGTAPAWALIMLPISFALLIRYLRSGSTKHLLLLGLCSLFAIANPFWIYLMIIMGLIYLIVEIMFSHEPRLILLKRSMTAILVFLALNAFWLVPTIAGYLKGGGGVFQVYTTEQLISFGGLLFLSHWKLLDVLMVGEHQYYFFWLHPQNYGPLNVVIPILAGISLLAFRRNRHVLFMGLVLVVGVFLTKGVHEPAGYLYYLIAKSLPYGAGALLRNPTKFVPLVSFSYAFLIGLTIAKLYERAKSLKVSKAWHSRAASYGLALGLILLVLAPVTYGTILDLQGYTWPRYKPTYIPKVYDELNSWLSNQLGDFKVMWIPSGGAYVWKPYIITAFPDLYSSRPAVSFRQVYPQPLGSTDEVGKLLKALGVKYVVYHGDSLDYPNQEILQQLLRQRNLKVVYELNYTYAPEDNSKSPLPVGQPDLQFSQSPFKLLAPESLPRGGEAEVVIQYTIPRSVVEEGFKGRFWAGFGIGLSGFSARSASLDRRVFWAGVHEQRMINETCGYAVFKVKVPYTYPGTAIDIYANFYDGSFRPLTPSYFVARLPVSPREVRIPFVVFENEEYSGPVYPSNLALAYGLNLADLMNVDGFDFASWSLVSVGEAPPPRDLLNLSRAFVYSNSTLPEWLEEWLASSNIPVCYVVPLCELKLPMERPVSGPYEPSYYVYDERPLTLIGEPVLSRGRGTVLNFSYYLPKPVLDEGYRGRFWAGFGIRLWGYPHGVAPPPDSEPRYRVFEAFISDFKLLDDCRGYVAFNVTVPESFEGTAIDIYANFYDGSFRPISPAYFVGTFKVRGTTLVRDGPPKLHVVRDAFLLNVYVPRSGEYVLALKAVGSLNVNGMQLKRDGGWAYISFPELKRGRCVIAISTDDEAYVQGLALLSIDRGSISPHQVLKAEVPARLLSSRQVSPVEWEVVVNASSPLVLVFTEPYDRLWRAYVNGKEVEPVALYGMVNGFPISETGILRIRIYYTLQTYFNAGLLTSGLSFAVLACLCIYQSVSRKRSSQEPMRA
jgi:hypothetical protein